MSVLDSGGQATDFASERIAAWNAHDLERILKHYASDVQFTSPFVSRLLNSNEVTPPPPPGLAVLGGFPETGSWLAWLSGL